MWVRVCWSPTHLHLEPLVVLSSYWGRYKDIAPSPYWCKEVLLTLCFVYRWMSIVTLVQLVFWFESFYVVSQNCCHVCFELWPMPVRRTDIVGSLGISSRWCVCTDSPRLCLSPLPTLSLSVTIKVITVKVIVCLRSYILELGRCKNNGVKGLYNCFYIEYKEV